MSRHPYGRSAADSRRRVRRAAVRRRHLITTVVVFTLLIAGLALAFREALRVLEEDSPAAQPMATATATATAAPDWCPEPGATPLPSDQVPPVRVLNATSESGLAGRVSDGLAERGLPVGETGNASQDPGPVEIRHAPADYLGAVTVQAHLGAGQLVADPEQQGITVVLGAGHPPELAPLDRVDSVLAAEAPRPEGC